jgi:hypothetical protein
MVATASLAKYGSTAEYEVIIQPTDSYEVTAVDGLVLLQSMFTQTSCVASLIT